MSSLLKQKPAAAPYKKKGKSKKKRSKGQEEDGTGNIPQHPLVFHLHKHQIQSEAFVVRDELDESAEGFRVNNLRSFISKLSASTAPTQHRSHTGGEEEEEDPDVMGIAALHRKKYNPNRLRSMLDQESQVEVDERRRQAAEPLDTLLRHNRAEFNKDDIALGEPIDIPKRPPWDFSMTKESIDSQERDEFNRWISDLREKHTAERLNYFELNLEVWRQLWRVCERADIVMMITDARFPLFHFHEPLYHYVVKDLNKKALLVLNKADLVTPETIDSWIRYFTRKYPGLLTIAFTSFGGAIGSNVNEDELRKTKSSNVNSMRRFHNAHGIEELLNVVRTLRIIKDDKIIDIDAISDEEVVAESDKTQKQQTELDHLSQYEWEWGEDESADLSDENDIDGFSKSKPLNKRQREQLAKERKQKTDKLICIATVGHPNVGKSSLINGLVGRPVVSTSSTPGHTKHFQTIFLTKRLMVCDCPGLVFPALDKPKPLQILTGLYPIPQVREPYSAIRFLAERVPLETIYRLRKPTDAEDKEWSPLLIAEALALQKGYLTAGTGLPDAHRAGLEILHDCLAGRISFSLPPPTEEAVEPTQTQQNSHSESQTE